MKVLYGAVAAFSLAATAVPAATLADLASGGTLSVSDVVFSNFFFEDLAIFGDDLAVDSGDIEITSSAPTAGSVDLTFMFDPALAISFPTKIFFGAGVDFDVAVSGSSRTFSSVTLMALSNQINATIDAFSEVVFSIGAASGPLVEIFDDVNPGQGIDEKQTTDSTGLGGVSSTSLFGEIEGQVFDTGATASLAGFKLTFDLDGQTPPPNVIPLPASLPLLAAGMIAFGALRRREKSINKTQGEQI